MHLQQRRARNHHENAEQHGDARSQMGNAVEPSLHDHEAIVANLIGGRGVVDEQPRQVEEPGEVGHHKGDVNGLEPEVKRQERVEHGRGFYRRACHGVSRRTCREI